MVFITVLKTSLRSAEIERNHFCLVRHDLLFFHSVGPKH